MDFKIRIDAVRRNPKKYVDMEISLYQENGSTFTSGRLLCLLNATSSYEFADLFERVDRHIQSVPDFFESKERCYYYYLAHGKYNRSILKNNEAMMWFSKLYDLSLTLNEDHYIARALVLISTIFDMNGDHEIAIDYAKKSLKLCSGEMEKTDVADVYMNYGLLLDHSGLHGESLTAFQLAVKYYRQVEGHETYLNYSVTLFNLGKALLALNRYDEAKSYVDEAMTIAQANDMLGYFSRGMKMIADFYAKAGEFIRANELLNGYFQYHQEVSRMRIKSIAGKHRDEFKPHFDSMHHLYQTNTQLSQELKALQRILSLEKGQPYTTDQKLLEIIKAVKEGAFIPFLQPRWSIDCQTINGAELLARWLLDDGSVVAPSEFIEIIENTDFMALVSEALLKKTLDTLAPIIRKKAPHFKLALNISPYQLAHHDLIAFLESCCAEYGIQPGNIEIEIIERTFIENNPKAIDQLFELSQRGFGIALDDFGSGYSSLSCVVTLPVDTVKIDRSLIKDLNDNDRSERLLRSIVAMVSELGIVAVAEGIETEEQRKIIESTGCHEGQGYLMAKPSALSDCEWLKKL